MSLSSLKRTSLLMVLLAMAISSPASEKSASEMRNIKKDMCFVSWLALLVKRGNMSSLKSWPEDASAGVRYEFLDKGFIEYPPGKMTLIPFSHNNDHHKDLYLLFGEVTSDDSGRAVLSVSGSFRNGKRHAVSFSEKIMPVPGKADVIRVPSGNDSFVIQFTLQCFSAGEMVIPP